MIQATGFWTPLKLTFEKKCEFTFAFIFIVAKNLLYEKLQQHVVVVYSDFKDGS